MDTTDQGGESADVRAEWAARQARDDALRRALGANMIAHIDELEALLEEVNNKWVYEDLVYRFYHQSFKVYWLGGYTRKISEMLAGLAPEGVEMCEFFCQIVAAGTEKEFEREDNNHWVESVGPVVTAFFHARYMLEMVIKYADELVEFGNGFLSSGLAALLELYNLR
jgi:hypothetical protein